MGPQKPSTASKLSLRKCTCNIETTLFENNCHWEIIFQAVLEHTLLLYIAENVMVSMITYKPYHVADKQNQTLLSLL